MIARKNVQNLKGGNEARGQVRRRLKFRPIFCPFFSFSRLSPLWLPFSLLLHTQSVLPYSLPPLTHARTHIFANFSLSLSLLVYRERASIAPHHPLHFSSSFPLVLGKPGITSLSHRPHPAGVHPRMCTPRTLPSAPLLIHLPRPTLAASLLSPPVSPVVSYFLSISRAFSPSRYRSVKTTGSQLYWFRGMYLLSVDDSISSTRTLFYVQDSFRILHFFFAWDTWAARVYPYTRSLRYARITTLTPRCLKRNRSDAWQESDFPQFPV